MIHTVTMTLMSLLCLVGCSQRQTEPPPVRESEQARNEIHTRDLGACRRIPSLAPEQAIFSSDNDGEAGDVGGIADTGPDVHRDSQTEEGPLEARSSSLTGSLHAPCADGIGCYPPERLAA